MNNLQGSVFVMLCLLAVTACQTVFSGIPPVLQNGQDGRSVGAGDGGFAAVPACATGMSAMLSDGVRIGYGGSDPDDRDRCLLHWSGRAHPLYFGLWNTDPRVPITDDARAAFRIALTGPVGTEASFAIRGARLWNRVTVTHVGNSRVDVAGKLRPALELRVVRHDAQGRPQVRAETRYAVDLATGVMLQCESVTPMADGEVKKTTSWHIDSLQQSG
jgi:hypothetical protein